MSCNHILLRHRPEINCEKYLFFGMFGVYEAMSPKMPRAPAAMPGPSNL